jgi:HD-GYP domain-containing protein (c-di-GMP phosphodiesterase class II)
MSKRRISTADIIVGQPLPWNVYGEDGRLLLRKGETVATESQVEFMVKKGLFSEVEDTGNIDEIKLSPKEAPSAIRMLNSANRLLRKTLPVLPTLDNAQEKMLEISALIYDALELNPDIAVASIFLNHEAGPYVFRHCVDTGVVAALIARSMNKSAYEIKVCICAALTSNLGMLDYQEHLDNKKEPLTQAEKDHIRKHPDHSAAMLQQAGVTDEAWLSYVRDHHENEDGSGYPNGKAGDQIPVYAKLIGLADRYCARVTGKDYRKQALPNAALRDIFLSKNKEIDPLLAPYFIKNIGLYPPGSFVKLKNDEIAVVVKKGDNPSNPIVITVLNKLGMPPDTKLVRDTANPFFGIKEAVHREVAGAKLQMPRFWGEQAAY